MIDTSQKSWIQPIFLFLTVCLYLAIFTIQGGLKFPLVHDENNFWETTQLFSRSLIPSIDVLTNYGELNTPLPFIVFGWLEYLFKAGPFAGRVLNLILSWVVICLIIISNSKQKKDAIIAACGVMLCPYYFRVSALMYTDIMAVFFTFLGFWFYLRSQHIKSGISFILAIASRQFMLVFPVAIVAFEIVNLLKSPKDQRKIPVLRVLMPLIAASSIIGWLLLFRGIAPQSALTESSVPAVQKSIWNIDPSSSLYFLASVGCYFVIPELILFFRKANWRNVMTKKNYIIAGVLLILFIIFPPLIAHGILDKIDKISPHPFFRIALFYILALLACVRFSKINLPFWIIVIHCGLMLKAYPWDKYVLPLVVVFWYFNSLGILDNQVLFDTQEDKQNSQQTPLQWE